MTQVPNLCYSCKHFILCDGECEEGHYLDTDNKCNRMYVIECEDYDEEGKE